MPTFRSAFPRRASGLFLACFLPLLPAGVEAAPCEAFRFAPSRDLAPLPGYGHTRVADLTGDGRPDVLVLDVMGTWVGGAVQRPDGTYAALTPLETTAFDLLTADTDGDGVAEGVLLREDGPQLLRVREDGTIVAGPSTAWTGPSYWKPWAVADLDRDGRSEILVNTGSMLLAFRADASDAFHADVAATLSPGGTSGLSLVAGDFDGDGDADVVVAAGGSAETDPTGFVLWGDGRGGLLQGGSIQLPTIRSVAVGDFDGDGRDDFVYSALLTAGRDWRGWLMRADGSGGLRRTDLSILDRSPFQLLAADLDRDGRQELVRSYGRTRLFRWTGSAFDEGGWVPDIRADAAADLDGDGFPDLVGTNGTAIQVARNVCGTTLPDVTVPVVVSTSGANG
ncbi:MAG: VCBS repeat-containing protein, partial [Deltaproteobacteria bacterium]|nr:VCBS repeat-containing protein [Deltaproteobacteria bacterium]